MLFLIVFGVVSIVFLLLAKIFGDAFAKFLLYATTAIVLSGISFVALGSLGMISPEPDINILAGLFVICFILVSLFGFATKG